jgi:hypothetical protein
MSASVSTNWTHHGLDCIRMENRAMSIDLLPERGANIFRLVDKATDRDVLWKSPRVSPRIATLHADFDDHWAGGLDDAFPGGRASRNRYGDLLPYMGEVWSKPASARVQDAGPLYATVVTDVMTTVTPARFTRTVSLSGDDPVVSLKYEIENIGYLPFDFNFGVHPSLAVAPSWRFDIPATRGLVDEAGGDLLGVTGRAYDWPTLDGLDLRLALPPTTGAFGMHYLTGLTGGWWAATDTASGHGVAMSFDPSVFPVLWFVIVYGGWRGYYQAIVEPWTGYPSPLDEAVAAGQARVLQPGETFETEVSLVLYDRMAEVTGVTANGVTGLSISRART